jgi:hypothetical protein
MNKLFLILIILITASSLQGMELPKTPTNSNIDYSKLSPITLPLIYHHFSQSDVLLPEIALHIFSLQLSKSQINGEVNPDLPEGLILRHIIIRGKTAPEDCFGPCLTLELLKRTLLRKWISYPEDIINDSDILHSISVCEFNYNLNNAKFYLQLAGDKVWDSLTIKVMPKRYNNNILIITDSWKHYTPLLHRAAEQGNVELVKLFLDAVGKQACNLIDIRGRWGQTALDVATPEVKEVMLPYLNKTS